MHIILKEALFMTKNKPLPFPYLNFLQNFKEYRDPTKSFSLKETFEIISNLPAGKFSHPDVSVVNLHRAFGILFIPSFTNHVQLIKSALHWEMHDWW